MQKSTKIFSNSPNSSKELNVILRAPLHFPHQLKTRAEFRSVTELVIQKRTRLARTPTVTDLHSSLSLSLSPSSYSVLAFIPSLHPAEASVLKSSYQKIPMPQPPNYGVVHMGCGLVFYLVHLQSLVTKSKNEPYSRKCKLDFAGSSGGMAQGFKALT